MKTIITRYSILALFTVVFATACTTSPEKETEALKDAKENVVDAKADLDQAKKDSADEYNKYKTVTLYTLTDNENKIKALKEERKSESATARAKYLKQLDELEKKNAELKLKMNQYQDGPKDKWEVFKKGFNHEVDELGKSISALATKK
jgi:hypothetical protein